MVFYRSKLPVSNQPGEILADSVHKLIEANSILAYSRPYTSSSHWQRDSDYVGFIESDVCQNVCRLYFSGCGAGAYNIRREGQDICKRL